jgi:hypothetical protein
MLVLSKIYCKFLEKCGFGQVVVFGIHQAARFIHVKTTSFTHCSSSCLISFTTS